MKNIASLLIFLSFSSISIAQLETEEPETPQSTENFRNYQHSIGFGLIGGGEVANRFYPMPGVGYKYFTNSGAFRVMTGGMINENSSSSNGFENLWSEMAFNIHAGYQYHVMLGRWMPIIGIDGAYGYFEKSENSFNGSRLERNTTFGLSPNIGIELWISPRLSLLLDTRFNISYRQSLLNEEWDGWGGRVINKQKSSGLNTHISPLSSFMACFHF